MRPLRNVNTKLPSRHWKGLPRNRLHLKAVAEWFEHRVRPTSGVSGGVLHLRAVSWWFEERAKSKNRT